MEHIKKVFVIHKTHLDIGFTDSAQHVLQRYMDTFIPGAIQTAKICNQDGKKNFVWTVGSFLIEHYLNHGKDPQQLLEAIQQGYIAWHGLAVTIHTELMDQELLRYDLGICKRLDERFGRHTIAAKMTDVPAHTHAMSSPPGGSGNPISARGRKRFLETGPYSPVPLEIWRF